MGGAHSSLDTVIDLGLELPEVKIGIYYGVRALKLNGRMLACAPVNKSAEVNSAVVAMGFERRKQLLKNHPSLYYITDHYAPHPTMLIRLSRISKAELERILRMACSFLSAENVVPRFPRKAKAKAASAISAKAKSRLR